MLHFKRDTCASLVFLDEIMMNVDIYVLVFVNDIPQISEMNKYTKYLFLKKLKQLGLTVPLTYSMYISLSSKIAVCFTQEP